MQRSNELIQSMSSAGDNMMQQLNEACGHIKVLEGCVAQGKELNAALERRLVSADMLIKQLRDQQKEDPLAVLTEIHMYIQKLRDAQERKKRKNNRAASIVDSGGEAGGAE